MKTNLEKWNHYEAILNSKTVDFMNSQIEGKTIPDQYFYVYPVGKIVTRVIYDLHYTHYKHGWKTYLNGKKPTKKDVAAITAYATGEIPFSADNIYFKYREVWDGATGRTSTSSVKFNDLINQNGLFHSLTEAAAEALKVIEENRIDKEFHEQHKKDSQYNYAANGYKFLGWQNGWESVYYDEDGNLCSETGKPHSSFGYTKEKYPEYRHCIDSKHRRIEVSHNQRGSENTVSCPVCKIYWKYDCSD